jgi:phage shock protein PspC (stress-responsive transcriptional regulator)
MTQTPEETMSPVAAAAVPARRLTRSRQGMIAGVCAGLAACLGINLVFVRLVFIVIGLANGIGVLLYLILAVVIPRAPAEAAPGAAAPCPPRSARKTTFAYVAGAVSICAALVSFGNNIWEIYAGVRKFAARDLASFVDSAPAEALPAARDAAPSAPARPVGYPPPEPAVGVHGHARVLWNAAGITYVAEISMAGPSGTAAVVYQLGGQVMAVRQRLAARYDRQEVLLVGLDSSSTTYSPDIFRLDVDASGSVTGIEPCENDAVRCYPALGADGQLQVQLR